MRPLRTISGSASGFVHVRHGVRPDFLICSFHRRSMPPKHFRANSTSQRSVLTKSRWLRSFCTGCLFLWFCTAAAATLFWHFFLVYLCRRWLLWLVVLQLDIRPGYGICGQPRQWKRQLVRPFPTTSGSDFVHVRQGVRPEFLIWCFCGLSMQPRLSRAKSISQRSVLTSFRWLRSFF